MIDVTDYDWHEAFSVSNRDAVDRANPFDEFGPRLEAGAITLEGIEEVIYSHAGENDEEPWIIVGRSSIPMPPSVLVDAPKTRDVWFSMSAWCDYTGWGCQDGGRIQYSFRGLRDVLIYGLSDEERDLLGVKLEVA